MYAPLPSFVLHLYFSSYRQNRTLCPSKDTDNEEHKDKDQTDAQDNAPDQPLCLSALFRVDVECGTRLA